MKSKKNLTRFTYETTDFLGWRMCIRRGGTTFTKYFSDKKYGGPKKALKAAEKALAEVKNTLESARKVKGKTTKSTAQKVEKTLKKS